MSLNETVAGRKILDLLQTKYGTRDAEILLECVVLDHFSEIFPGLAGGNEIRVNAAWKSAPASPSVEISDSAKISDSGKISESAKISESLEQSIWDMQCKNCPHPLALHTGYGNCEAMVSKFGNEKIKTSCACKGYENA